MKHPAMNPCLPLWEYVPDGTEPGTKMFDPGVLVDEDGRVFLYIGFCPTPDFPWALKLGKYSLGFELEPDMHTIKAGPFEVLPGCQATAGTGFEGHGFYEASSPRKSGLGELHPDLIKQKLPGRVLRPQGRNAIRQFCRLFVFTAPRSPRRPAPLRCR